MKKFTWIMLALCTLACSCSTDDDENLPKPGADIVVEAPQNVAATIDGSAITLNWDPVANATYNVYRSADDTTYSIIASGINTASYADANPLNGVNYYCVNAVVNGVESNSDAVVKISYYECVDLGLSVKWAACNVGASKPEEYGVYFAWGEIAPKSEYIIGNSVTFQKEMGNICGNAQYDAATANWGAPWRLPTKEESEDLSYKCTWEWSKIGDHYGYKVTGPNGNSIFLPTTGYFLGTDFDNENIGYYWTGTPSVNDTGYAYSVSFSGINNGGVWNVAWEGRHHGQPVRPVTK